MANPYCTAIDVRAIMLLQKSELDDPTLTTIIAKAQSDIDSELATMYDVPFNDVAVHPDIPEKIRWITAEMAKCIAHNKVYDDGEPNETDSGDICYVRVQAQLKRLRICEAGLVYHDGSPVPRIGDCPEDSPGPENQGGGGVLTNTINDDAIFSLDDINPNPSDNCCGRNGSNY